MRVSNIVRICCVVIISILSIGSFFWFSCLASPSDDCVVDAEFDLRFISGTNCVVEISAIPSKLITDKVYTHSDIVQASGEELGALKYAMFLMIEDQLDVLFQNAVVQNFSLPMHNNGVFTETIDVSLSPSFFNLNASVEIDTLIDGFLDLGASIRYFFPFPAERGWNNTFSIHLPMYMVFESANTIEVSQNGDVLTWRVNNWQGGNPQTAGEVLLREQSPTSNTSENEEIQITFKIDGRSVSNIFLNTEINANSMSTARYTGIPSIFSHVEYLPADGMRLLVVNNIISIDQVYNITFLPVISEVVATVKNSSFNHVFSPSFSWDDTTILNTTTPYDIHDMNAYPPIRGRLLQNKVELTIFDFPARAIFGLLNAGGSASVSNADINFGQGLESLLFAYNISLHFPAGIVLNEQNPFIWDATTVFSNNMSSSLSPNETLSESVKEDVVFDISKMDLNIFSIFSGSLSLTTTSMLTSDQNLYYSAIPSSFELPSKLHLSLLNADAFRLCIEEGVFSEVQINNYFSNQKNRFIDEYSDLCSTLALDPYINEAVFYDSLAWDGDIISMDGMTPILTQISSTNLYTIGLNVSIIPPLISIANQTFHFSGDTNKTLSYRVQFPKGISITIRSDSEEAIRIDETSEGRQYLEVTLPASLTPKTVVITCQLTASLLYILSLLLPLLLSFILVVVLIILILWFRRTKRAARVIQKRRDHEEYQDEEYYIHPPQKK